MSKKIHLDNGCHTNKKILNSLNKKSIGLNDEEQVFSKFLNKLQLNKELKAFHQLTCWYDNIELYNVQEKLVDASYVIYLEHEIQILRITTKIGGKYNSIKHIPSIEGIEIEFKLDKFQERFFEVWIKIDKLLFLIDFEIFNMPVTWREFFNMIPFKLE